jgi:hypothetical protein
VIMPRAARSTPVARLDRRVTVLRALTAALAGLAAALLVACGSSGKGLIPASAAGPLKSDFEEVEQAAESANGDCAATEAALLKTERDFSALPASVDSGLRNNLRQGIANLRVRAREVCVQPGTQTTTTNTSTTTSTPTTTTPTTTTPTSTTPTTPTTTTPTTPGSGGGTPAPGEEEAPAEKGKGGGAGEGGSGGVGAGGQEPAK